MADEQKEQISYEEFAKLDIRTAKVLEAEPLGEKLIKMLMDVGGEKRTIVAGIRRWYKPEELVGKTVIILYNLKGRKILGVESQGMVLGVDGLEEDGTYTLIVPEKDVPSGRRVR